MDFDITSTGSAYNYTRSYYMNGRDYIISGSCDEHVVRICCAQTGRRLRDVYVEVCSFMRSVNVTLQYWYIVSSLSTIPTQERPIYSRSQLFFVPLQDSDSGKSMFVQSLRGDPFRVSLYVIDNTNVLLLVLFSKE